MANSANIGGLKAAAKRTAFGDVSNTKNLQPGNDSAVVGKKPSSEATGVSQERNPAPPLRPAQRPLSVSGLKAILNVTSTSHASHVSTAPKQPPPDIQTAIPRKAITKRSTIIFKDDTIAEREQPTGASKEPSIWPATAPVHQSLVPRHHKSQPYMRAEQPVIRRTKSKHIDKFVEEDEQERVGIPAFSDEVGGVHSDSICQDGGDGAHGNLSDAEEPADEIDNSGVKLSLAVDKRQTTEKHHTEASAEASFAEPEEYWEDEDEDEYCDEEGYTTARSRGENTTGGATTILFPQVTTRARKELAAARQIVESTRTPEDIDEETWDTSMVAEYGDEIFQYMRELEVSNLSWSPSDPTYHRPTYTQIFR
jgi:G2/mitotic-specific cyclin 3/4